ncbi:hypothetical protein L3Q82_023627, partial [Scortum barcoo]
MVIVEEQESIEDKEDVEEWESGEEADDEEEEEEEDSSEQQQHQYAEEEKEEKEEQEEKEEEMVNRFMTPYTLPNRALDSPLLLPLSPPQVPGLKIATDVRSTIRVREKHQCLEPLEDWFYTDHFHRLMKILYTPRLIPAVQCLLRLHHMVESDQRVECVTQYILHELKGSRKITDTIFDMDKAKMDK